METNSPETTETTETPETTETTETTETPETTDSPKAQRNEFCGRCHFFSGRQNYCRLKCLQLTRDRPAGGCREYVDEREYVSKAVSRSLSVPTPGYIKALSADFVKYRAEHRGDMGNMRRPQ